MIPLAWPPEDYHMHPPFLVTLEWADGRIWSDAYDDLVDACDAFLQRPGPDEPDHPDRRTIIDARGVHVLGIMADAPIPQPVMVMSDDLIDELHALGANVEGLLAYEMLARAARVWEELAS